MSDPGDTVIIEPLPVQCPRCKSFDVPVQHTDTNTTYIRRYRKCECGHTFKTIQPRLH